MTTGYARENLREIGLDYFDLLLLHAPCGKRQPSLTPAERVAANAALWQGLVQARDLKLTRAIGVSNYVVDDLEKLPSPLPAVNQCNMGVKQHDDTTIAYCQENGILLTGDNLLRKVASARAVRVHGVLWIIDELHAAGACDVGLLVSALQIWRADEAVFLPPAEIDKRLRRLEA